jgi:hypothetical protein
LISAFPGLSEFATTRFIVQLSVRMWGLFGMSQTYRRHTSSNSRMADSAAKTIVRQGHPAAA